MSFPSICVVIPARDSQATIRRALESIACQTYRPAQIIVVDDASTDGTVGAVQGFADLRVDVIMLGENRGASEARKTGIRDATADLVAFLDADDEWLPAKLERQVKLLLTSPESTFASCRTDLISPAGENLGNTFGEHEVTVGRDAWKALLADNFVTTPSVLVWRKHLEELGGFDRSLKIAEDQDMWIRLAERGCLSYVHECLVREYEHERRLSGGGAEDQLLYTLPMIEGHLARLSNRLTPEEIRVIRGSRYSRIGRLAFSRGAPVEGRRLVSRAVKLGYEPIRGSAFLARTCAPAMWLKRMLRHH